MPSKPASFTQEARYTTGLVVPPMGRPSQVCELNIYLTVVKLRWTKLLL